MVAAVTGLAPEVLVVEIAAVLITTVGGASVLIIGFVLSRRLGLSEGQQALVRTLQATVEAQDIRLKQLAQDLVDQKANLEKKMTVQRRDFERKAADQDARIEHLERENERLARLNARLLAKSDR
jgi:hypothetical protein